MSAPAKHDVTLGAGPFARLAITQVLSTAGDAMVTIALAGSLFFSISPSAARGRVALSLLLTMAPFAVVAPFLGPAIDRSAAGRRIMAVGSNAGRALLCVAMAAWVEDLWLFPLAFGALVLSKGFAVARASLVPSTVDTGDELVEANAKLAMGGVIAGFAVAGPAVAILRVAGSPWVLRVAAAVFALATIAAFRITESRVPLTPRTGGNSPPNRWAIAASSGVVVPAAAMATLRAAVGFLTFLVAFGFRRTGAPAWWFGLVLAAAMAGTLAASLLAPRLRDHMAEERIIGGGLALVAVSALAVSRLDGRLWSALVAGSVGLAAGGAKLAFDAIVQRDAPETARSRSFARYEAGFQLVWVVGALFPVAVAMPLPQGQLALGLTAALATAAYATTRIRSGQ